MGKMHMGIFHIVLARKGGDEGSVKSYIEPLAKHYEPATQYQSGASWRNQSHKK